MYKIIFYVPLSHLDVVKNALFTSGAGKIGQYSNCAWQTLGEGQFMPLAGSNPFLGNENQIETVAEYKVEMVCDATYLHAAIAALKKTHPYEQPAYYVIKIEAI